MGRAQTEGVKDRALKRNLDEVTGGWRKLYNE
jgi:hypothetical protein